VVREYCGAGLAGQVAAELDAIDRRSRNIERAKQIALQNQCLGQDQMIEEAFTSLDQSCRFWLQLILEQAGYYQHHRGEWRKRRDPKKHDCPS
jgi:hypothetical protein